MWNLHLNDPLLIACPGHQRKELLVSLELAQRLCPHHCGSLTSAWLLMEIKSQKGDARRALSAEVASGGTWEASLNPTFLRWGYI